MATASWVEVLDVEGRGRLTYSLCAVEEPAQSPSDPIAAVAIGVDVMPILRDEARKRQRG